MNEQNNQPQMETDPVAQLQDLRQRLYDGEEISAEEYEKVLTALRAGRRAGATNGSTKKKSSGTTAPVDADRLLQGLVGKSS